MKFSFDKFVNDIVEREDRFTQKTRSLSAVENTASREYNQKYREHWQNSTYFSQQGAERSRWKK
jgi:hypothetical protein